MSKGVSCLQVTRLKARRHATRADNQSNNLLFCKVVLLDDELHAYLSLLSNGSAVQVSYIKESELVHVSFVSSASL